MLSASYLFLHECLVCRTNLSRSLYPRNSILTIVINKQIILVNICAQMMKMVLIMMWRHLDVNLGLGEGMFHEEKLLSYMQKTCDVAEKAILAKKHLRKKCVNRNKM